MILIYTYIKKYKNYVEQEIVFDDAYRVSFVEGRLSIRYQGVDEAYALLRGDRKPDNLHLLVGKTGSGKTNLLQLIGMKHDVRMHRKWEGEDDSYFLLYKINDNEFFLEICDVDIQQFPGKSMYEDPTMPEHIKENARRMSSVRTIRFALKSPLAVNETYSDFSVIPEYGWEIQSPDEKVSDMGVIINSYDIHAFIRPPYPDEKEIRNSLRLYLSGWSSITWMMPEYL